MISSNIYAPTFLVLMFMGMFIPYSQSVFMKAREKEYGILLTLGMTENEVRNSILIENVILCIVSLIIGLVMGTFLSLFFWAFIHNIIGINKINVTVSIVSYKITTICVLVVFVISLIVNVFGIIKSTVYDRIKYTEKAESGSHYSLIFIFAGIVFTITAFIVMIFFYRISSNIWFLSLFFCILGSALIFFNGEALIQYFKNKYYKKYIKNIFLFSDIKYYYGKNKKVFFATTWLFFAILFFIQLSLVSYPSFTANASAYHPFHMVYAEIKDNFKPLKDNEVKSIVQRNGNRITTDNTVKFVRNNNFTVFCVDDVNKVLKKNYKIQSNSFIYVHPYDINDGYEHSDINSNIPNIDISSNEDSKNFIIQDTIIEPLFGQIDCISNNILLVNKKDYEWITLNAVDYYVKGTLHLYNFTNWHNSGAIVNETWNKLLEKNNMGKEDDFYKISSRIEAYNTALKSSNFLIFNIIYISFLLYFSAIVMIHYKLKMEYKDEKRKYFSFYRIGIEKMEIKEMLSQKILIIYSIPCIYAVIINIPYSYYTNSSYGYGIIGILYAFITSFVFLIIHLMVYRLYFTVYFKGIISELKLNNHKFPPLYIFL